MLSKHIILCVENNIALNIVYYKERKARNQALFLIIYVHAIKRLE